MEPAMTILSNFVANGPETAIQVFRAATELGIRTVAVCAEEDNLSLIASKLIRLTRSDAARAPLKPIF
jgi:pyruvate carboxylase